MKPLATRPPGRPKKYQQEARLSIKTEAAQKRQLEAAAKSAGKTLTDFLLGAAFALLGASEPAFASLPATPTEIQNNEDQLQGDRLRRDLQPQTPVLRASLELAQEELSGGTHGNVSCEPTHDGADLDTARDSEARSDSGDRDSGEEELSGELPEDVSSASILKFVPTDKTLKAALGVFVPSCKCKKRSGVEFEGKPYCGECSLYLPWQKQEDTPSLPEVQHADCSTCDNRRFTLAEVDGKCLASRCVACAASCALCKDSGYVLGIRNGYEAQIACSCKKSLVESQIRNLNAAQLPGVYVAVLFGKLPPKAITESQKQAHLTSWQFTRSFDASRPNAEKGFFFHGPAGTGKTLALCRAAALIAKNTSATARYINLPLYLQAQKDSWNNPDLDVDALPNSWRSMS